MSDTTLDGANVESGQEGNRKETDKKVNSLWISGLDWLMKVFAYFQELFVHAVVALVYTGTIF